ncbi:MAG: glutamate N-acetyltransferase / amino-acid N-acetyltransferase [Methanolobus sp.]|jgi:glutamate N-acetyltransferase/amino-acid N-acetyltransferase|uniref:bifunctional ornithine acetyltransferase/N-acetylglutamate synthase n=1 Tax=unclassified Methanolobus TaxID=2629569 RepID=UPI0025881384|nr:bifunctional ornithine acetyltransferase/N-acetylglutamate synthase [Methanolobus sp.]MDK2831527.1 glutamate N-acetyltransferase / amino-acid N-acetyltransferase [Methanolobus sp.]MDK2939768.1 glutamate N-acetyltransferase / amino-acid N-acetyltransferase [Methanolobus sp.]
MKFIEGGICAVKGVRAGGIKPGKMGLAIIQAEGNAAGVYTRNKVIAAPLVVTREHISKTGRLSGVVVNSGNANAFTGVQGLADARIMASSLASKLDVSEELIGVASTGVVGRKLDTGWITAHIDEVLESLGEDADASMSAARSIMTTDTVPKEIAIEMDCGIRIAGIAKGAGMIEPNMGTMLAFVYTDAEVHPDVLQSCLTVAVDKSFNMIVVDGDTSTNDMVLVTATGQSGIIPEVSDIQAGLDYVLTELAKMIAVDGEGATKLIESKVTGAATEEDARLVTKAIVRSPLVKSAIFGQDPNWGRIVVAAGYSGANMDPEKISLSFSAGTEVVELVKDGEVVRNDEETLSQLKSIMAEDEIYIITDLGMGDKSATAWGCDLTYDYVRINAEYTT